MQAVHRVGDGDCGSTLRRGAEAMQADLMRWLPLNDAAGTLKGLARTLRAMGGTSGVLYVISLTAAAGKPREPDLSQHHAMLMSHLGCCLRAGQGLAIYHSMRLPEVQCQDLSPSMPIYHPSLPACRKSA